MNQGTAAIEEKLKALKEFQEKAAVYSVDAVMDANYVVLDMNFSEQLSDQGINRNSVPIMDYKPYQPFTIDYKKAAGQPYDRVTLEDSGDFHSGGELVRVDSLTAEIISTDPKSEALQNKYGKEILGLTADNMDEVKNFYVKPYMINKLNNI
jgi:hypothetical protein